MSLHVGEERFRSLVEHSIDVIALIEPDGTVSYVSPSVVRVLGYAAEEFAGLTVFDHVHPDEREAAARRFAEIVGQPGDSRTVLNRIRHKDGSWRWIETVSTNQLDNPSVRAVIANMRDVTDRIRVEEALREREECFLLASEALKDADRRKDEFLAMLAHELRNPLAAINNAAQLSLCAARDEDLEWSKNVISRQAKQLARLLDDLLDVSRITRGQIQLRKERIDLAPVISRALETVRPLIEAKQCNLTLSIAPDRIRLYADPLRIEQVLVNLLTNAAKYTGERGNIALAARADSEVILSVADDGVGIPRELLPHVFDLFAQADRTMDRFQGGLGIGLTLVKKLIEMHGGTVIAASDGVGAGSEFVIRLPSLDGPAGEEREPDPGQRGWMPTGLRVLVVEDNRDTAIGMTKLLRAAGCRLTTVHDGTAALEAARTDPPDVVLMDIGLPGMDGYTLAEQLRRENTCANATLIAISGYGPEQDRRGSRQAGFHHHLVKPVDYEHLLSLLAPNRHGPPGELSAG